jgi:hypothetical protein
MTTYRTPPDIPSNVLPMNPAASRTEVFRRVSDEKRHQLDRIVTFTAVEAAARHLHPGGPEVRADERMPVEVRAQLATLLLIEAANTLARVLQWEPIGPVTFERAS